MKKVIILFILVFLTLSSFAAEDWAILKDDIPSNLILRELIKPQGRISYCIDGSQTQVLPDINKVFQMWFDNVLSYRNIYPDFDNTFKDIVPILERKNKMVVQQCATPFRERGLQNQKINNFVSQRPGYNFAQNKPLLRLTFCYKKECLEPTISGACKAVNNFERRIFVALDADNITATLAHELGHTLALGDVLYGLGREDRDLGHFTLDTMMYKNGPFTCDDADAIVAVLYMAMKKPKTFYSFCGDRLFENGHERDFFFLEKPFDKEYKKYKKLENLNRLYDKPIKEIQADFNMRMLQFKLQQNPDYIKSM